MSLDRARRFAEAIGLLAKTDRVDTKVLARYRRLEGLEAAALLDKALADLQDPVLVRRPFVDELAALGRIEQDPRAKTGLCQLRFQRAATERRVKALDNNLLAAIEADAGLRRCVELLRSIPGIGPATAARLLAVMPELGRLGRHAAPRCVDYMGAVAAIRPSPPSTSAPESAASNPKWPSSPSCANSSPSPTPSSVPTAPDSLPRPPRKSPLEPPASHAFMEITLDFQHGCSRVPG